ncbi:YitT family protein [Neobacillus sp. LXY-4]|uniref:YitT family protein n=1 Tax=Neobacillus sp. LXY-4 TaxID=3379826 RepID=UPI003EDF08F9
MYKDRVTFYSNQNRTGHISLFLRSFFISCGAALVAISLQFFLMKNFVIDGGIVGIAILLSHIWSLKVGTLLFILNAPFLIIGSFYLGIRFLLLSLYAILVLATGTNVLEPYPALTDDPVLVILIGGFLLGLGVGVIIRFGGSLDGTEVIAILLSKRSGFSIGQFVMIMNIFIFGSSIFVFGLREFIYSLATFFIAYRTIDFSIQH